MSKGYWVAFADVSDPEGHKAYIAENAKAFRKYGGRFLTRAGRSETPEGQTRSRVVVIEFTDYAAALECYRSPEYPRQWLSGRENQLWIWLSLRGTRVRSRQIDGAGHR